MKTIEMPEPMRTLVFQGTKMTGTLDYVEALSPVQEEMTGVEYEIAKSFLTWVANNDRTFGHENIHEVWSEFVAANPSLDYVSLRGWRPMTTPSPMLASAIGEDLRRQIVTLLRNDNAGSDETRDLLVDIADAIGLKFRKVT